jgi:hypothetical protein
MSTLIMDPMGLAIWLEVPGGMEPLFYQGIKANMPRS